MTGSNPTSPAETVTGALAVAGATGYVAQSVTGTHGLFQLNADGSYTYTLTIPVTELPASNNGADTVNGVESFSYTAHDASNNTVTGTITINVIDDVPIAPTVTVSAATVGVDETPGVQITGGASDVLGTTRSRSTVPRPRLRGCLRTLPTRVPIPMFPLLRWTMAR